MSVDISVVIGFRDWGLDRLRLAAQSILTSFGRFEGEVLLSDYGSADPRGSEALAAALGTKWVYTPAPVWSRSRALNAGMAVARGEVLVSTDADMIFSPTSFERICELQDADPDSVRFLQCRDLPPGMDQEFVAAHPGAWELLEESSRLRHRHGMGGMMAISREGFRRVRGFDERLHTYGGEDIDFAERAKRAGYRWHWVDDPAVRMYHMWHPPSLDQVRRTHEGRAAVAFNRHVLANDPTYIRNVPHWEHELSATAPAPLVTVAIVTQGRGSRLQDAVRSVLAQSVQDVEIVVVDEGGDDGTADMLKGLGDERIRYVRPERSGLAAARNIAVDMSRGEFVAFLDDDVLMPPDRLERHLENHTSEFQGSCGALVKFDPQTGELTPVWGREATLATAETGRGSAPDASTWFVRRSVLAAFRFNESLDNGADEDLMLRMVRGGVSLRHTGGVVALRPLRAGHEASADQHPAPGGAHPALSLLRWGLSEEDLGALEEERKASTTPPGRDEAQLAHVALLLPDRLTSRDLLLSGTGTIGASVEWDGELSSHRWERGDQATAERHVLHNASWADMVAVRRIGWAFEVTAPRDDELAPSLAHLYSEIESLRPSRTHHVVVDESRRTPVDHPLLETLRLRTPGSDRSFDLYACDSAESAWALMSELGPRAFVVFDPALAGDV